MRPSELLSLTTFLITVATIPLTCHIASAAETALEEASEAQSPKALQVLTCLNTPDCGLSRTTWDHLLKDQPSCIRAHRAWWPAEAAGQETADLPVTLVTQLSVNRLPQLRAQCQTWQGTLAAAVYLAIIGHEDDPLDGEGGDELSDSATERIQDAEASINKLTSWAAAAGRCQLRVLLLVEAFRQDRVASVLYPVNRLRNYARLLADSPLVANIDVDMLPSLSLSASLRENSTQTRNLVKGCVKEREVYVVPAFETSCGGPAYADGVAILPKDQLPGRIDQDCLLQFRQKVAPACHNVTDFARWFKATEAYQVDYKTEFEPWFISDRLTTQWFDVRFRGYGKNKIVQVAATAASRSPFLVHPSGFLVHRQHPESPSRKAFLKVKFKSRSNAKLLEGSLYSHIEALWNETQAQMAEGMYKPALDPALQSCLSQGGLPWWQS